MAFHIDFAGRLNLTLSHYRVRCDDDVVCYIDGSRIERTGLVGAGVYVQTDGEELVFPHSDQTSV